MPRAPRGPGKAQPTDKKFLAIIEAGNYTQKAITLATGMSHSGVRHRIDKLIAQGKLKKVARAIEYRTL